MSKTPWEDLNDAGYSTGYQVTDQKCATEGCDNDAGTFWSYDLCPMCTRKKMRERNKEKPRGYRERVYSDPA